MRRPARREVLHAARQHVRDSSAGRKRIKRCLNSGSCSFSPGVTVPSMDAERAEALEVLRDVWRGQAQSVADLDDSCESHCKRMTDGGSALTTSPPGTRPTGWKRGGPGSS